MSEVKKPVKSIGFGDWYPAKGLDKYLKQIIKSRRLTYGPISQKLEKLFAEMNGVKYAVFCSSGTAALYASIGVLKNLYPEAAAKRKYIVLPATTFISDCNVITSNGFEPLFVDVGANYNICYTDLESKLKEHSRDIFAVMPSSLMGRPVDGLRIKEIIDLYDKDIFFILDSCENICSRFNSQYPESFAHFTAWSTYISHLLVAGGCGGFIGTNDERLIIHARSYVNHGRSPEYTCIDDDDVEGAILRDITSKRFKFVQPGLNFRLGETESAFALSMLEDDFLGQLQKRKENSEYLIKELSQFPLILPKFSREEEARHMMLPIRSPHGEKWELIHFLEKNGIETREILPLYTPITEKYFGTKINFRTNFPMSWEILERGFYIGCHSFLTKEDLNYIIRIFGEWFNK